MAPRPEAEMALGRSGTEATTELSFPGFSELPSTGTGEAHLPLASRSSLARRARDGPGVVGPWAARRVRA